jgi:hypothetical protein
MHAQIIERKNEIIKKMWKDVEATSEMLWEMFEEMNESKHAVKIASTSADKAATSAQKAMNRSSDLYNKLSISTSLVKELKDEICNEIKTIEELRSKVDEYEVIIGMEHEYKDECNKHCTRIASIEAYYYQEFIANNNPRYVMKHWVKNKTHGKY